MHTDDRPKLTKLLNLENDTVKKYSVFVFELCDGNISKKDKNGFNGDALALSDAISICSQLLKGLIQLKMSNRREVPQSTGWNGVIKT